MVQKEFTRGTKNTKIGNWTSHLVLIYDLFGNRKMRMHLQQMELLLVIRNFVMDYYQAEAKNRNPFHDKPKQVCSFIGWDPPSQGLYRVNGACNPGGQARCRVLLRDNNGRWIIGFLQNLGQTIVIRAEL